MAHPPPPPSSITKRAASASKHRRLTLRAASAVQQICVAQPGAQNTTQPLPVKWYDPTAAALIAQIAAELPDEINVQTLRDFTAYSDAVYKAKVSMPSLSARLEPIISEYESWLAALAIRKPRRRRRKRHQNDPDTQVLVTDCLQPKHRIVAERITSASDSQGTQQASISTLMADLHTRLVQLNPVAADSSNLSAAMKTVPESQLLAALHMLLSTHDQILPQALPCDANAVASLYRCSEGLRRHIATVQHLHPPGARLDLAATGRHRMSPDLSSSVAATAASSACRPLDSPSTTNNLPLPTIWDSQVGPSLYSTAPRPAAGSLEFPSFVRFDASILDDPPLITCRKLPPEPTPPPPQAENPPYLHLFIDDTLAIDYDSPFASKHPTAR